MPRVCFLSTVGMTTGRNKDARRVMGFWPGCKQKFRNYGGCKESCTTYSTPPVDRIWLWVYYNKMSIYPLFYLLKRECKFKMYYNP